MNGVEDAEYSREVQQAVCPWAKGTASLSLGFFFT